MSGEDVIYAVRGSHGGIVVCGDLGSACDLAGVVTGSVVLVSRDGGRTWEEVSK